MSTSNFHLKTGSDIQAPVFDHKAATASKFDGKRKLNVKPGTNSGTLTGTKRNETPTSEQQDLKPSEASDNNITAHRVQQMSDSGVLSIGATMRTDAIMEEIVEDSAPNTKRASVDEHTKNLSPKKD